jgi:hypothetical protein
MSSKKKFSWLNLSNTDRAKYYDFLELCMKSKSYTNVNKIYQVEDEKNEEYFTKILFDDQKDNPGTTIQINNGNIYKLEHLKSYKINGIDNINKELLKFVDILDKHFRSILFDKTQIIFFKIFLGGNYLSINVAY